MAQHPPEMDRGRPFPAGNSSPVDPALTRSQSAHAATAFLDPATGPQTVHNQSLFFIPSHTPAMNAHPPGPQSPPVVNPLYPYHQQAYHYPSQSQHPQHQSAPYAGQFTPHRMSLSTGFQAPPQVPPKPTGQYHPSHANTLPHGGYNPQQQRPLYQRPGPVNGYYHGHPPPHGAMSPPPQMLSQQQQFAQHHAPISMGGYFQHHPQQFQQQQHPPAAPATPPPHHQPLQPHQPHHPGPPGAPQPYQRPNGPGSPQIPYQGGPLASSTDLHAQHDGTGPVQYQTPPAHRTYSTQSPSVQYQPLPPPNGQHQDQNAPPVQAQPPQPIQPPAPEPEEDASDELAMVLALSQSEEAKRNQMQEELEKQEEDDLARALAESLRSNSTGLSGLNPAPNNPFLEDNIASSSRILVEHLPRPQTPKLASPSTPIATTPINNLTPERQASSSSAFLPGPSSPSSKPTSPLVPSASSTTFTDEPDAIDFAEPDQPMPSYALGRHDKWRIPSLPPELPLSEPLSVKEGKRPERPEYMDGSDNIQRSPSPVGSDTELAYMRDDDEPGGETELEPESSAGNSQVDVKGKRNASFDLPERQPTLPGYDAPSYPAADVSIPRASSPVESSDWHGSLSSHDHDEVLLPTNATLVFDDEAFARRLAAEEGEEQAQLYRDIGRSNKEREADVDQLPQYSTIIDNSPPNRLPFNRSVSDSVLEEKPRTPIVHAQPSGSSLPSISETSETVAPSEYAFNPPAGPSNVANNSEVHATPVASSSSFGYSSPSVSYPVVGNHRQSMSAPAAPAEVIPRPASQPPPPSNSAQPPRETPSLHIDTRPPLTTSVSDPIRPVAGPSSSVNQYNRVSVASSSSGSGVNANTYISRQLLLGISIGFEPPRLSQELVPMESPMPNIISLPYSRCPPLHFQAPDWRHMLQLMARLSGTRIEPTVESMAISKNDLKLRIVVQFVKPNPTSDKWRTVLWFTIDHPVPRQAPGASKYLSNNPNLLPWSYTQPTPPVPRLLKDGDSSWSKIYTIPPSEAVPLPNLPISLPNLALYLQAALDHSRRVGSSGDIGKLGKMVQTCYPMVEKDEPAYDIQNADKAKRTHLFKRVIGKATGKGSKKEKGTHNNETYQLVTPFVPDEWG